jgi:hypothetical protein
MWVTLNNYVTQKNVWNHETVIFCRSDSTKLTAQLLWLIVTEKILLTPSLPSFCTCQLFFAPETSNMLCIKKITLGFETLTLQVKNTYVLKILKQFKKK